jgi:hypothetical protein
LIAIRKLDLSSGQIYPVVMSGDSLRATFEIAITAIAEELYDNWPPSSPGEVIHGVEERLKYRLYGGLDSFDEEEDESW